MNRREFIKKTLEGIVLAGSIPLISCSKNPVSPDDDLESITKIAFSSNRDGYNKTFGYGNYDIYIMNPDGSGQTRLTFNDECEWDPAWSPNGTKIAYTKGSGIVYSHPPICEDGEIWVMNSDGSNQIRLSEGIQPAWSPDGSKIAYSNDWIWLMDADGSNRIQLTNETFSGHKHGNPSWSPDGSKIVFNDIHLAETRTYPPGGEGELYVIDIYRANFKRLTNNDGNDFYPSWSPDGSKIAFTTRSWWTIDTINKYGNNQKNLVHPHTNGVLHPKQPCWSPDGAYIAFSSGGISDIYKINSDGSETKRLTNEIGNDIQPAWSPFLKK